MKIPLGVIFVAVVLFLVIAFSSCSNCQKYVPYSSNVWSETSSYREGMAQRPPLQYSSYPSHQSLPESMNALNVNNSTATQGAGAVQNPGVRLWGFGSGLYSSTENDKPIDIFGSTPGSLQCFNRSFGLSKSTGPLCTTQEQYDLLTTRGRGAAGVNAQIGGR